MAKHPLKPQVYSETPITIDMTAALHAHIKSMFEDALEKLEREEADHRKAKRPALADQTDLKWKKLVQHYGRFMNQTTWEPTSKGERL